MDNQYVKDYITSHRLMIRFVKQNEQCPPPILKRAEVALVKLRDYLDYIGVKMPKQKYPYCHEDIRTWRYIPDDGHTANGKPYWNNPSFMYRAK